MSSLAINELNQFLAQYKVEKGNDYTHTSMGKPAGSYNIPPEKKPELLAYLHNAIFNFKIPVHLTEKPPNETMIKADLDFKFQLEEDERKYTIDHVRNIVQLYHNAIKYYLDVPDEQLKAFVFERNAPYKDRGNTKDGIHIMYPHLICDTKIQHLIRDHVLLHCQSVLTQLCCKNSLEDILDKSIISSNNWLMYGCSKPTAKPYALTHIFDCEFNDLNIKKYTNKDLLALLSIRDHDVTLAKPIKAEYLPLLEKKKASPTVAKAKAKRPIKITKTVAHNHMHADINLEEVRELTKLLSVDRSDSFASWRDVGLCLHNIDTSLLDSWVDFSRLSSKYKDGECEDMWINMEFNDDGLGIGSLHRWAQMDNRKEYAIFTRNNVTKDILKSQSQTTQDVARVVYNLYKYQYKCTSIKYGVWYEFINHRWTCIDSGVSLRKKLGNDVVNEYLKLIEYYNSSAHSVHDEQKDQFIQKSKNLTDVTYRLRDYGFKEKIMKECQIMFYDPQFETSLDANPDLIGFENGVYDLKAGEFRNGRPEDCVSLSTGNDYEKFDEEDEYIVAIYCFLSQVFIEDEVRDYVLVLLASFLEGRNPNEKFHIWTGVGGNGKSKLLELFESAFGKYTAKIPVTVLTQKGRASSSSANPEVARLKGIRTVSTQEPEENERFNVGIMKDWTGGDRITCRAMYREPFDFKPQFKMVFCCNHLPGLPPDDEGTWRRVSVIDFKSRFVDKPDPNNKYEFVKDTHLTDKLHAWRQAFMYILLENFKKYKKEGLIEPDAVKAATKDYQKVNDNYIEFIDDCLQKDATASVKLEDVFKRFREWWKENFGTKTPTRKDMKACLEKKLGKYLSSSKGGWVGYKLIDKVSEEDEEKEVILSSGRINEELATT
jgi:P4 family phage/plasmid primase-like protien